MKKTMLIGVSAGIAAYKTLDLVKNLVIRGIDVRVIMTASAASMIRPHEFEEASKNPVMLNLFDRSFDYTTVLKKRQVDHITLANNASLLVIVPATANVIAKIASGIADDYLTTTVLAATCPIMVAPSMNVYMWKNPITQKNIETLRKNGMQIIGPDRGMLACGYEGEGRLVDIQALEKEIIEFANKTNDLAGKHVIVTAGGTIEPIDEVRVITNRSSGKMGVAIAEQCFLRGARVTLFRSQTSVSPRYGMKEYIFDTPESLQTLLKTHALSADICIHAAAVSDFQVKEPKKGKIPSGKALPLELTPRAKILDSIKSFNRNMFLVSFKAEWGVSDKKLIEIATSRLLASHCDLIVANDVARTDQGFQADDNEVFLIEKSGMVTHIPKAPKTQVAQSIVDKLITLVH